jgi:hypothetical protein
LDKQRAHGKRHLNVVGRVFAAAFVVASINSRIGLAFTQERRRREVLSKIRLLERLLDVKCRDCQRANHLEGKEADDIGGIIVGLEVDM